jgi:multidrug resistance efflux pump
MKRTVLPIVAVVAAILAMISVARTRPKREPTIPPSAPPTSSFEQVIAGVGLVEANSENIDVSCAVSGMVTQLYVKAGDRVGQSQKLFSLDDRDLRADQQVKRTALEGAQARLAKLEQEPRAEDIPPAEERVREAQANLADAEVQVRLIESVTDKRAVRDEDVQRRRLAYKAAQARLAEVEAQLGLLKAGAWAPDIAVAKSEVAQAEAQVKMVETNIDRLTMRAPIAGVILQNKVRLGQYAQCGPLSEPLMILGGVNPLHVRVDVDERDAWRVRGGTPAVASPRGNGSIRIHLEFVRFEPYVIPKKSLTGDSTERVDTRVLQVIYRIRDGEPSVYVGQQMDVYIEAPSSPNAGHPANSSSTGQDRIAVATANHAVGEQR